MIDFGKIKLIVTDCDGVLTDGVIIYDDHRTESKNFSAHDGLGVKILSFTSIKIAVVTGRKSSVLVQRCKDLNIQYLYQNIHYKKNAVEDILSRLELSWENVAYIGDDWNDWPAMEHAQIKVCPANAVEEIRKRADFVTEKKGGDGAVRELIDKILYEQGIYEETIQAFLNHLHP